MVSPECVPRMCSQNVVSPEFPERLVETIRSFLLLRFSTFSSLNFWVIEMQEVEIVKMKEISVLSPYMSQAETNYHGPKMLLLL